MRRNNCFVAILAICTILPILRNGSAREQLPPNYEPGKFRTNNGKAAYQANVRNNDDSALKFRHEALKLKDHSEKHLDDDELQVQSIQSNSKLHQPSVHIEETVAIFTTKPAIEFNFKDANIPNNKYFPRKSNAKYNTLGVSLEEPRITNGEKQDSRSEDFQEVNERGEEKEGSAKDSITLNTWSIANSREKRSSSRISPGTIKNFFGRRNDVIHRTRERTYETTRPWSRKTKTVSVKANHRGKRGESSAIVDVRKDVTGRTYKLLDIKQLYGRVKRSLRKDKSKLISTDGTTTRNVASSRERDSAEMSDSPVQNRKFDVRDDGKMERPGESVHGNIEFSSNPIGNVHRAAVDRRGLGDSIVNKLTEHETTDFNCQSTVPPVPTGRWLDNDGSTSEKSTFDKNIEKSAVEKHLPREKGENVSTLAVQSRSSNVQTTAINRSANLEKSVYNLMDARRRASKTRSFKSVKKISTSKPIKLIRTDSHDNSKHLDVSQTTIDSKPTVPSFDSRSSNVNFEGYVEADDHTKRHETNANDDSRRIGNLEHSSTSHKSERMQLTEGTYGNSEPHSKQRSRVSTDEDKDNSDETSFLLSSPDEKQATFSASSTTINIRSILREADSTEYPPSPPPPSSNKRNSVVPRDTFVPFSHYGLPEENMENPPSRVSNFDVKSYDITDGKSKWNIHDNGKTYVDETLSDESLKLLSYNVTDIPLSEGLSSTKMYVVREKISNSTIKSDLDYSDTRVVESNLSGISSGIEEREKMSDDDDTVVEVAIIRSMSESSTAMEQQPRNVSVDSNDSSIANEWNATDLKRDINSSIIAAGGAEDARRDADGGSAIGSWNSTDPSANSEDRSGKRDEELSKNSRMLRKIGDRAPRQLYLRKNSSLAQLKIDGDTDSWGRNAAKWKENGSVDGTVDALKFEAEKSEIGLHGKESIPLMKPSKVVGEVGDRAAENYAVKNISVNFAADLNDFTTNDSVIASSTVTGMILPARNSLDQDKEKGRMNSDEIENNESSRTSSASPRTKGVEDLEREEKREKILHNAAVGVVNSRKGTKEVVKDPKERQSDNPLQLSMSSRARFPGENASFRKGRKSRESKEVSPSIPNDSTVRYKSSTIPFDLEVDGETVPVSIPSNDGKHEDGTKVMPMKIDSGVRTSENDGFDATTSRLEGTIDLPLEFTTNLKDRSNGTIQLSDTYSTERSFASKVALTWPDDSTVDTLDTKSSTLPVDRYQVYGYQSNSSSDNFSSDYNEDLHELVDNVSPRNMDNSSHEVEPLNQWPVKHSAVVEGDLVLGGLMMVHEREDTITCGPVMPQGGVQALEAMLYTLDTLNDREIVPGVKIGAHILDDCDKDTYGLEMAVDFIKGSISNIDGAEYHCNKTAVRKVISGVVGAASSVTSIQVANLLRLFRIPQVSFFSTSPELSNKQRFEYFTRTIPSDHYQVKAMVDIVLTMGWSYVSIIYEESNYGIKAFEELEELLGKYDICIAIKEKLVKDSGVAEETAYDNIVLKLLTKPRARGCIIFGSDQEVAGVMRAVRRCNATGAFSWIGSDGWSARGLVSNGNEPEVEGTLSVQPQANPVKGFEEYFLNLTVENNRRNPWFVEFWEDHFQCRYPNASRTPYNQKYTRPCTTKERLTKQNTVFEDQLQFVSDAVMAFAYAFRDMHNDFCDGKAGLCDTMKPTKGTELLKYLRKVEFEGLSGDRFKFDKNGDGPARYNIIHFKQTEPGKYKWVRVGKYLEGELRLNMSEIQFKLGHPQPPESVCSLPCEVGQAKKYVEGERCCWHCFNCTQYQVRHPEDETQCIPCRQGTVPDETHSHCRDIPEEFLRPESGWAIGAMSFSSTGILITFFVCGVFLKHNDTPVVRASGRELSYVLLSGILLCYLVTFALVIRPTDIVCGIQRFAAGFCFTVVYAALLTKTNRISRIFNAGKHSAKRPSFISPRSQLIICSGLVFVQILINGVWMVIDPARAMHHYPTREDNLLVCNSYIDASYMIAFAYPIMLIVVCTVYAVLTRKIPEAFNESKHIGFTMYTTCVIWLAFVPLYFGTGNNVALRITSMSVTISLSASVTIACLFSPKLYIILIRPERNVRQSMMPGRYSTTKSSAVTATNASSMIAPITLTAATCDQNKTVKKHIITTIDCSTQSEYYELEVKDQKNGKPSPSVATRSTQTSNEKDSSVVATSNKDAKETTKQLNNNARIGNGPLNQSDVSL